MNPHLARAYLLAEQSRHDMAVKEFQQALGSDPHDPEALAHMALSLSELKQHDDATAAAQQAIALDPDYPYAHFALGRVMYMRDRYPESLSAIEEAIRLDPEEPLYRAFLAAIHLDEKRWEPALQAADDALQLDPEHAFAANMRSRALVQLGRGDEAREAIHEQLSRSPDNSHTHANMGWAMLERGDREQALHHFREALRLDPDNEWARQGMVSALKSGNALYALMLRYSLEMSKRTEGKQWAILLGAWFVSRFLGPLRIIYIVFVFLTWTIEPLSNLLLRLNAFGRLTLSRAEVTASNWVGGLLAVALASLGMWWGTGNEAWSLAALVFGFMLLPVAAVTKVHAPRARRIMTWYAVVMGAAGVSALIASALAAGGSAEGWKTLSNLAFGVFLLGLLGVTWVANVLAHRREKV